MIKATDLRIGNKLQKDNGEIFTVLRLDITSDVLVEEQRGLLTLNYNLFGIPLTEEWLVRLGFKKWGRNDIPRTLSYELAWVRLFPSNSFCDFKGYGFMHYKPKENEPTESARVVIQYVHQLQNLYHSLTGQELEI